MAKGFMIKLRFKAMGDVCRISATPNPNSCWLATQFAIFASIHWTRLLELLVLTDFGVCLPVELVGNLSWGA